MSVSSAKNPTTSHGENERSWAGFAELSRAVGRAFVTGFADFVCVATSFSYLPVMFMQIANTNKLVEHARRICDRADRRSFVIVPLDRDLLDAIAIALRKIENLDVKRKTGDLRLRKESFGCLGAKSLEPALRVWNASKDQHLDKYVVKAAHHLAIPRLMLLDERASFKCAAADHDVIFSGSNQRDDLSYFCDRSREIRIGEDSDIPLCFEHSARHRRALALVLAKRYKSGCDSRQ